MEQTGQDRVCPLTPARQAVLGKLLKRRGMVLFEYHKNQDRLILYDENFRKVKEIPSIFHYLKEEAGLLREDLWIAAEFFQGNLRSTIELQFKKSDGAGLEIKSLDALPLCGEGHEDLLFGYLQDVTSVTEKEKKLEEISRRDSLTGLYNHSSGKALANQYLRTRDPYCSCGMMILDIDYFKNVNDSYGHLFGDEVLIKLAELLEAIFDRKDILVRAGGDEFAVFLKNIDRTALAQKASRLVESVRRASFSINEYCMTCSVGVCFLQENQVSTWEQLFENADHALYRAKENGRNQYVFCDNLRLAAIKPDGKGDGGLDARYLRNDVVATAFEIFEKTEGFDRAINLLLKVIGIRYRLDRITVIHTDIREQSTDRQYQWRSQDAPEALVVKSGFTREDFLTLFRSYDEYGTTVLQYDDLDMYSAGAQELLMQGQAKTVVYAAMYSEGRYTGAISYVDCKCKRFWSRQNRKELGELTKIIVAYLTRHLMSGSSQRERILSPETDPLTGLMSFPRFQEELEQKIVAGYASGYGILSADFMKFAEFSRRYGSQKGDELLCAFGQFLAEMFLPETGAFLSRSDTDQFFLYFPCPDQENARMQITKLLSYFLKRQEEKYPEISLELRAGMYQITPDCLRASSAIEAAGQAANEAERILA